MYYSKSVLFSAVQMFSVFLYIADVLFAWRAVIRKEFIVVRHSGL